MLAGGYAGELQPTASEYVAAILDSVARLSALIDDVLDLTQSDSGSLLLAEDKVDLARLCAEAADNFRDQAAKKNIDFAVEIETGAGSIAGDRARLRQSLDNVLKNAFAYTGDGGRVLLHAAGNRKAAAITVSDNGRGIAHADQAGVFDRFSRTAEPRGADGAALGLGLPLAKQFVEAHGGTIELVSEPGEGTTVTLRLPRKR
jgi:signal transduction histidine kinase